MCGFVGFTNYIADDGVVLSKMMESIVHRGPDSSGSYIDNGIALGFRRLSIIDLEGGNQPMFNEDESLVLVFNGEIYNSKKLRSDLIQKGHVFSNNSDKNSAIIIVNPTFLLSFNLSLHSSSHFLLKTFFIEGIIIITMLIRNHIKLPSPNLVINSISLSNTGL